MALTIGIDARAASEVPAGRGRVVRELLRALAQRDDAHTYHCYARTSWSDGLDDRFRWRRVASADPWWHLRTSRLASRECGVFLSSNSYLTPGLLRIPNVSIVYDLIAFDPAAKPKFRSMLIERAMLGITVRRSAGLVAISHTTADELVARFPSAAGRVSVAPLGVSSEFAGSDDAGAAETTDADLPDPGFVLAVGTLEPRKNLPALVNAYQSLDESLQRRHPLVVAGPLGWKTGETLAALRSLGDRSRLMGHVSDAMLAQLYRRCAVFCYPSLSEGFGLPVLEAMAAGAPVVTSDRSSLPEVGGDAVEYADPTSVSSIAAALARVLESPERRVQLSAAARRRAAEFTWSNTADVVLRTLEQAAGSAP